METAIGIAGLVALIAALLVFAFGRRHNGATAVHEALIQAKENSHRKEMDALRALYESRLEEKETTAKRDREIAGNERALMKEAFSSQINEIKASHAKELDRLNESWQRQLDEQKLVHENAIKALKENFAQQLATSSEQLKTVTADMLKKRQEEFAQSSEERIGQILNPLQNSLAEMRKAVTENTTTHTQLGGQLGEGLKTLLHQTQQTKESAEKLATALKGSNKAQGDWGEKILKELLESQGLTEGRHFDTQASLDDSDKRPDVILHLDATRDIVIDSKVSLSAYLDYRSAETDAARNQALDKHVKSLQNHVKQLSGKDYSRLIKAPKVSVGYVIMFVPNTSALLTATAAQPDLWRKAMEQNVYIADEQTLYAALRIIDLTWSQIEQAHNQEKVFALAGTLITRVEQFLKHYKEIGEKLDAATKSHAEGLKKLKDGGHSIPQTARQLQELGARSPRSNGMIDQYLSPDE